MISEHREALQRLAVFTRELPDPERILFRQEVGQFILFATLPPEIRLRIWKSAFPPGRAVCLNSVRIPIRTSPPFPSLPVTAYVNEESRTETLKHYHILPGRIESYNITIYGFKGDVHRLSRQDFHGPICVNPLRDTFFLEGTAIFSECFLEWVKNLACSHSTILDAVDKLAIHHVHWRPHMLSYFRYGCQGVDSERPRKGALQHFRRLRELQIRETGISSGRLSSQDIEEARKSIVQYFEAGKLEDPESSVPKVIIESEEDED